MDDVSFRDLQSFNNAVKGKTGIVEEIVNGSSTLVQYKTVKAIQNNWVIMLLRSQV